jgi:transposase
MKRLEMCNVKLSSVASDVFGVSGRAMVRALVEGTSTPAQMAQLARGSLRKKNDALTLALEGRVEEHHRRMLKLQLERVERIESDVAQVDGWIDKALEPHAAQVELLLKIPGIERASVIVIVAELGVDMSVFPTASHAAAWAGVSPGNSESAGKRLGSGKRHGNVHLTTALVQAAAAAGRVKKSYLREKFWRLRARRGHKRALVAVAHQLLTIVYVVLRDRVDYKDLGTGYLDRRTQSDTKNRLLRRLRELGYNVEVKPAA